MAENDDLITPGNPEEWADVVRDTDAAPSSDHPRLELPEELSAKRIASVQLVKQRGTKRTGIRLFFADNADFVDIFPPVTPAGERIAHRLFDWMKNWPLDAKGALMELVTETFIKFSSAIVAPQDVTITKHEFELMFMLLQAAADSGEIPSVSALLASMHTFHAMFTEKRDEDDRLLDATDLDDTAESGGAGDSQEEGPNADS
jgi:hypothetical protein